MRVQGLIILGAAALLSGCFSDNTVLPPDDQKLAVGTWGGDNAGVIVDDTVAHVHVGCTLGNFSGPVALDNAGRFSVTGEYLLRAYPIAVGPTLPAQFTGTVRGNKLTLTIAVNDTVEKKTVTLGPVTVTFDQLPHMGPCPICRKPTALLTRRRGS
jgi:hypothetical protein